VTHECPALFGSLQLILGTSASSLAKGGLAARLLAEVPSTSCEVLNFQKELDLRESSSLLVPGSTDYTYLFHMVLFIMLL